MKTETPSPQGPTHPPATPRQALQTLVDWALKNRFCSTAATIRSLLLSLYNGEKTDFSAVQFLDTTQRKALASVIIGIGRDQGFWDYEIRDTFAILGGETALRWFFEPTGGIEEDLLRDFVRSAERNGKAVAA